MSKVEDRFILDHAKPLVELGRSLEREYIIKCLREEGMKMGIPILQLEELLSCVYKPRK